MKLDPRTMRLLIILSVFAAWEVVPRILSIPPILFPPLSAALVDGFAKRELFASNFVVTLLEAAAAVSIACGLGLAAGMLIGVSRIFSRALVPMASTVYAVPIVVLYPLFTVWLGIGPASKIAFGSFYGFIPTLLATAAGVATIPVQFRTVARSYGATSFQQIAQVLIPAAIPTVISGIRLGGALAIVGVIAAEMLTSASGLGFLISQFRTTLDTPGVFFSVICVIILVVAFELLMARLNRVCQMRWAPWKLNNSRSADPVELAAA